MKPKTIFACQECGAQSAKWLGRCPECGAWNSLVEETPRAGGVAAARDRERYALAGGRPGHSSTPTSTRSSAERLSTGIGEFDRVLGGGIVPGFAGAPRRRAGHRQVDAAAPGRGALRRQSARSSTAPVKNPSIRSSRAANGSASSDAPLYLLAETCLERILEEVARLQPALADRRLDPDRVLAEVPVRARQRRSGARGGDAAAVRRQGPEHPDVSRRPRHEGRQPRRAEGARARRRHRAVLRGRAASRAPRRARGEEPVRRGQRAGRVRDDRRGPASRSPNPSQLFLAERPANVPGSAVLCCDRGIAADPRRGAGARQHDRPSAMRAGRRAASIRIACRCCSRCSTSAPA